MEVIEKLIAGHVIVKEKTTILKKLILMSEIDQFLWENVLKLNDFFDKEVTQHFLIEENVLFPIMKKVLPEEGLNILREIEEEHKPILEKLDAFKKMVIPKLNFDSKNLREKLVNVCEGVLYSLIPHAEKEDEKLFPLVKRYFSSENYRELEDKYFKYLGV